MHAGSLDRSVRFHDDATVSMIKRSKYCGVPSVGSSLEAAGVRSEQGGELVTSHETGRRNCIARNATYPSPQRMRTETVF